MDIPPTSENDVLVQPIRALLFQALAELRRPATTQELAAQVDRHPNTVRAQPQRLTDAGLLERRRAAQVRRPVARSAARSRPSSGVVPWSTPCRTL
jgi:predicted transcriptional regulator